MAIKRISVRNFKSFDKLDLDMSNLTILVGKNASGKSNFVEIFTFLRDITEEGLEDAVSMHGGSKYVCNTNLGASEELKVQVLLERSLSYPLAFTHEGAIFAEVNETEYKFAVKFHQTGSKFQITDDTLTQRINIVERKARGDRYSAKSKTLGTGEMRFHRSKKSLNINVNLPDKLQIDRSDLKKLLVPTFMTDELTANSLQIEALLPFNAGVVGDFQSVLAFDIDPKLPKKATPITGKMALKEDGSNLALILSKIAGNREDKRKFSNLLHDLLPFVENIRVETFGDKSLLFKLKESYSKKGYLPASFLSDGTIHLIALIVALYFSKNEIVIIEEPERGIHPQLMSKIVEMLTEVSENKQIIVTTHNPELVKHTSLDSLRLISRNNKGMSEISRPADSEAVKTFLESEVGLGELFVQDILGV